jgi:hypothetical protein
MSEKRARYIQYAALPLRQRADATIEIMLITSRDTGRWLIPKGRAYARKSVTVRWCRCFRVAPVYTPKITHSIS